MKRASIPTSVSAPQAALAAAFRRIRPVSDPKKLKPNVRVGAEVNGLVQLDLALLVLDGHDRVFKIHHVFPLQLTQSQTDLFRLIGIIVTNDG